MWCGVHSARNAAFWLMYCPLNCVGNVNNGGEVLSDGDIHIYGKLHGRVICGLKGDSSSKVYCRSFDAALVGISDAFVVVEDHLTSLRPVMGKPVCISYHSSSQEAGGGLHSHVSALRNTSNDSSSNSQAMEPAVKIPMGEGEGGYVAFTVLPS